PVDVGSLPEVETERHRGAAGIRRPGDYRGAGTRGARLDSNDEIRLAADLHLLAERAGVHRTTDCRSFPARNSEPAAQREMRSLRVVVRVRPRICASFARARQVQSVDRIDALLVREHQLPSLRG